MFGYYLGCDKLTFRALVIPPGHEQPAWDEYVVFERSQTLARFWLKE